MFRSRMLLTLVVTVLLAFPAVTSATIVTTTSIPDMDANWVLQAGGVAGMTKSNLVTSELYSLTTGTPGTSHPAVGCNAYTQIGDTWPLTVGDWTGTTTYKMAFTNHDNADWLSVNLFVSTGWTDSPWSEPNSLYESWWTTVAPLGTEVVTVDLSSAANLDHVNNYGFQAALINPWVPDGQGGWMVSIEPGATWAWGWAPQGYQFDVELASASAPEPLSVVVWSLLGLSGIGVNIWRRRRV